MGGQPGPHAVQRLGHLRGGGAGGQLGQVELGSLGVVGGRPGSQAVRHRRRSSSPPSRRAGHGSRRPGARSTCASTKRRRTLWVPGRRRARATISSVVLARRRSTPAPKGTSTSWRSGRWRVRTARASTLTMRTSPLSLATAAVVDRPHPDLGHQPGHRREAHPGLAQRGQHLLDVAQEERVGPTTSTPWRSRGKRWV